MPERIAAPTRLAEVDRYITRSAPFAQPILNYLRDIVHEGAPGVIEEIKWSRPFFVYQGIILGNISAFKAHCSFGLWGTEIAASLRAEGYAQGEGMGTFGKLTDLKQLPPRNKLLSYLHLATSAIDEGTRTTAYIRPRTQVAKTAVDLPKALAVALNKNKPVAKIFAAMSPSCRKEYCVWIASAKRDETRDKRVATAIEWIAAGKPHNWRYETTRPAAAAKATAAK